MHTKSKRNSFVLVVAIFFVAVFSIIGAIAASLVSSNLYSTMLDIRGYKTRYIAEAGIRYTIYSVLAPSLNWNNAATFSKSFNGGSFSITYPAKSKDQITVKSTATYNGTTRKMQTVITRQALSRPSDFGYGLFAGNQGGGPLIVQNSATIDGDFYYNGDVTMKNFSTLVNGVLTSNSLTLQNSATCASWEGLPIPPLDRPVFDPAYYNNLLQETTKSATSALTVSGSTVFHLYNQTLRYTSITIQNNARIEGPGTFVCTTGDLNVLNSAIIGEKVKFIVKGNTNFSNSVSVGNTVEVIAEGSISISNGQNFPKDDLLYSEGNILFNNSSYFYGSILAPFGDMTSVNSTHFRGLIYAYGIDLQNSTDLRGSVIVDNVGYFSNSATVTYDPSALPSTWPQGLTGMGYAGPPTTSDWKEVY